MKLKSIANLALSALFFTGLGAATLTIASVETHAATAVKKKTARKSTATSISLENKTYKGVYYTQAEQDVEIFFQPGFVCSLNIGGTVSQGTYKVTGKKVTIKYWDGADLSWTFDIKNNGTTLYYEESTPRHSFECELKLVK